jgi:hypothetical protein
VGKGFQNKEKQKKGGMKSPTKRQQTSCTLAVKLMHRPANKMVSKKHQVPRRRVVINSQRVKKKKKRRGKKKMLVCVR